MQKHGLLYHYFVLFQTTFWMAATFFLIVIAMSALNSFAGHSVESLAHFLRLKGFPEEIVECLLGMVIAFFDFVGKGDACCVK